MEVEVVREDEDGIVLAVSPALDAIVRFRRQLDELQSAVDERNRLSFEQCPTLQTLSLGRRLAPRS